MLCLRKYWSLCLRACSNKLISLLNVSIGIVPISYARRCVATSTLSRNSKLLVLLLALSISQTNPAQAADLDWVPRSVPASKIAGLIKAHKHHWWSRKPYQWDYRRTDSDQLEVMTKPIPDVPDLRTYAEAHPVKQFFRDFGPAIIQGLATLVRGD